jgi:hypothetical protein
VSGAAFAAIGAVAGGVVTALSALVISYYQRTSAQRDTHLRRASENHLSEYEGIFVTCRSTIDALNDYAAVEGKVQRRDDPFLFQLLDILKDNSYKYCVAVDWRHNSAMGYLELALEEKCLHLRDLLLTWLSVSRITTGEIVSIRQNGQTHLISASEALSLAAGDYHELKVESRQVVAAGPDDSRLISDIRVAAAAVIKELRAVMAY